MAAFITANDFNSAWTTAKVLAGMRRMSEEKTECVDSSPIKKRGPRGKKGKIIDALRRSNTPSDPSTYDSQSDEQSLPDSDAFDDAASFGRGQILHPQTSAPIPFEYPITDLYPTPRCLVLSELVCVVRNEELHDHESCFAFSLAIYTLLSSLMSEDYWEEDQLGENGPVRQSIRRLYAVRSLIQEDIVTTAALATSLVLFHCFTLLGDRNTAWFHLREATTLATAARTPEPWHAPGYTMPRQSDWLMVYCILYAAERDLALRRYYPITLPPPDLSALCHRTHSDSVVKGMKLLVSLYRPFDEQLLMFWLTAGQAPLNKRQLVELQDHVYDITYSDESGQDQICTIDIACAKHWLKVVVWQAALRLGLLATDARDTSFTFVYPIKVAHGEAMTEKLFDVAYAVIDVIQIVPLRQMGIRNRPSEVLERLYEIIEGLPQGAEHYLPLLLDRARTVPEFPAVVTTQAN
ncbi:hypothetical protein Slin15195_G059540 [Septoria linicola]|uniref:Transcription factor domain-containing protein n=1 Tax=Septoria linicola TaxID=215465 RepID=A0A9Q9EJ38_9PEZI|nr:hypothetical protein Slin14017_G075400 [Septoria linicola]USW52635.1 hypothetical protein Slin15195_G059540 [Septoria linicola]